MTSYFFFLSHLHLSCCLSGPVSLFLTSFCCIYGAPFLTPSPQLYQDATPWEMRSAALDRGAGSISFRGLSSGSSRPRSPGAGFFLGNEIEVSIPSCALRGSGADEHYDFQLHLIVGEDAWSVYRR